MFVTEESIAHPDHMWLQPVIDHEHAPPFICQINSSMVPIFSHAMPNDVQRVDSNGDLHVSAQCLSDLVMMFINLTKNDPHPLQSHQSSATRVTSWTQIGTLPTYIHPTDSLFHTISSSLVLIALYASAGVAAATSLACAPRYRTMAVWTDQLM